MSTTPSFAAIKGRLLFAVTLVWLAVPLFMWRANVLINVMTVEEVLLATEPVDPHDLLRGAYVTLRYDFSRINRTAVSGAAQPFRPRQRIYAVLQPEATGEVWRLESVSPTLPRGRVFIKGKVKTADSSWLYSEFGIESYFTREKDAKSYEDANRSHELYARVRLTADGKPVMKALEIKEPHKK